MEYPKLDQSFSPHVHKEVQYSNQHALQTLDLTIPFANSTPSPDKYFIIHIHGGAWKAGSSANFNAARQLLLTSPACTELLRTKIAGLASLNHGLSPQANIASGDLGRKYKHPQHLEDLCLALKWLGEHYGVGRDGGWNYVLVGHSAGAMMAYQLAAGIDCSLSAGMKGPSRVVGIEGIYDLRLLVENHSTVSLYRDFVEAAFGENEEDWDAASPALHGPAYRSEKWYGAKLEGLKGKVESLVIAHSKQDELVEEQQAERMVQALQDSGLSEVVTVVDLQGKHDEVWEMGDGVATAICSALSGNDNT